DSVLYPASITCCSSGRNPCKTHVTRQHKPLSQYQTVCFPSRQHCIFHQSLLKILDPRNLLIFFLVSNDHLEYPYNHPESRCSLTLVYPVPCRNIHQFCGSQSHDESKNL